ncbi:MAG: hypothetical protein VX304_03775, partial [Planctomycetota bacterium]|nr:hypothetical protein [Planctomycetota bacterium]
MNGDGQLFIDTAVSRADDLIDTGLQSRLCRLTLEARRRLEGSMTGRHRSRLQGFSAEFAEHREYVAGDDVRYV